MRQRECPTRAANQGLRMTHSFPPRLLASRSGMIGNCRRSRSVGPACRAARSALGRANGWDERRCQNSRAPNGVSGASRAVLLLLRTRHDESMYDRRARIVQSNPLCVHWNLNGEGDCSTGPFLCLQDTQYSLGGRASPVQLWRQASGGVSAWKESAALSVVRPQRWVSVAPTTHPMDRHPGRSSISRGRSNVQVDWVFNFGTGISKTSPDELSEVSASINPCSGNSLAVADSVRGSSRLGADQKKEKKKKKNPELTSTMPRLQGMRWRVASRVSASTIGAIAAASQSQFSTSPAKKAFNPPNIPTPCKAIAQYIRWAWR